ncbi:unnamed protein product [Enterobius vermicularis]|uniref:Transcription factor protein n=1 Tax=Enterobius vermicularis TaxID=51028 RepID=A0A158QAV9_ENTVE|nr:unnamed protein product [Enterobius vermicularis]
MELLWERGFEVLISTGRGVALEYQAFSSQSSIYDFVAASDRKLFSDFFRADCNQFAIKTFRCRMLNLKQPTFVGYADYEVYAAQIFESRLYEKNFLESSSVIPEVSCALCVARLFDLSQTAAVDQKPHLKFTVNASMVIISAESRNLNFDFQQSDIINCNIKDLCIGDDRIIVERLSELSLSHSPEIRLQINNHLVQCKIRVLKHFDTESVMVLGCYIDRVVLNYKRSRSDGSDENLKVVSNEYRVDLTTSIADSTSSSYDNLPSLSLSNTNNKEKGTDALSRLCTTIFSEPDSVCEFESQVPDSNLGQFSNSRQTNSPTFMYGNEQGYSVSCSGDATDSVAGDETTVAVKAKKFRRSWQPKQRLLKQRQKAKKKNCATEIFQEPSVRPLDMQYASVASSSGTSGQNTLLKTLLQPCPVENGTVSYSNVMMTGNQGVCSKQFLLENNTSYAAQGPASGFSKPCSLISETVNEKPSKTSAVSHQPFLIYQSSVSSPVTAMQPSSCETIAVSDVATQGVLPGTMNSAYTIRTSSALCQERVFSGNVNSLLNQSPVVVFREQLQNSPVTASESAGQNSGNTIMIPQNQQLMQTGQMWATPRGSYIYRQPRLSYVQQQYNANQEVRVIPVEKILHSSHILQQEQPCKYSQLGVSPYTPYEQFPSSYYQPSEHCTTMDNSCDRYETGACMPQVAATRKWPKRPSFNTGRVRMSIRLPVKMMPSVEVPSVQSTVSVGQKAAEQNMFALDISPHEPTDPNLGSDATHPLNSAFMMPIELYDFNLGNGRVGAKKLKV